MVPRELSNTQYVENNTTVNKIGRPEMDNTERTSDPSSSETGRQPKPSNPEGSMDDAT